MCRIMIAHLLCNEYGVDKWISPVREEYGRRKQPDAHTPQEADHGGGDANGQRNACQGGAQRAPDMALQEQEGQEGQEGQEE